jgi:hypothetical protein
VIAVPKPDGDLATSPKRTASSRSTAAPALLAVGIALIAAVALLSHGSSIPLGGAGPIALPSPLDVVEVLGYVALLLGLALLPVVVILRRQLRRRASPRVAGALELTSVPRWVSALGLLLLAALVAGQLSILLAYINDLIRARRDQPIGAPATGLPVDPATAANAPRTLDSLAIAVGIVIAIAVIGVILLLVARHRDGVSPVSGEPGPGASTAPLIGAGLDALRLEPDPRRAVIRAYAAMEGVMSRTGLAREAPEGPTEYLQRVTANRPSVAADVATLSRLFQVAKFSLHEIDEAMRRRAIDAMERLAAATGTPR